MCCEYLSARCIWLYVLTMSSTRFWVNPHSIVVWVSRNSLLKTGAISEIQLRTKWLWVRSHFNFRYSACFEQGVSWHSRNYMRTCSTALVVRGIHRNVDICQTDYDIPSKLEFSPYFEMIHGCTTLKLMKY